MPSEQDKAGAAFWDNRWTGLSIPKPIDPRNHKLPNHLYLRFHRYFSEIFDKEQCRNQKLLEIGCARSRWMPYFAREFGFDVTGIDYSEIGCEQANDVLKNAGIAGRVVHSDFTTPPEDMLGAYDALISFGVVEHFTDTSNCVETLARFLKPGGVMFTLIPNFAGSLGTIQKIASRPVYDVHVIMDREDLAEVHKRAGLTVESCDYFLSVNWTVVSFESSGTSKFSRLRPALLKTLSMPFWLLERCGLVIPQNRATSPYVVCLARKPIE